MDSLSIRKEYSVIKSLRGSFVFVEGSYTIFCHFLFEGCVLTIVQVLLGVHFGVIIQLYPSWTKRIRRYFCMSSILALFAILLTDLKQDNGLIPVNKNLWWGSNYWKLRDIFLQRLFYLFDFIYFRSLTYVFATNYLYSIIFIILAYMTDMRKYWSANILVAAGRNAIILYIGHTVAHKMLPWHWRFGAMNTHFILLLESLWNTGVWLVIASQLDHNHIYYNV